MLEEIHATPEDRRTTLAIVAIGLVITGLFTVADAFAQHWNGAALGVALASTGLAMLAWLRARTPHPPTHG